LPKDKIDFSVIARLGSGSAVRSVFGGIVQWEKGWTDKNEIENDIENVSERSIAIPY
jgi:mevalonate pyrophosphate decarboxylase